MESRKYRSASPTRSKPPWRSFDSYFVSSKPSKQHGCDGMMSRPALRTTFSSATWTLSPVGRCILLLPAQRVRLSRAPAPDGWPVSARGEPLDCNRTCAHREPGPRGGPQDGGHAPHRLRSVTGVRSTGDPGGLHTGPVRRSALPAPGGAMPPGSAWQGALFAQRRRHRRRSPWGAGLRSRTMHRGPARRRPWLERGLGIRRTFPPHGGGVHRRVCTCQPRAVHPAGAARPQVKRPGRRSRTQAAAARGTPHSGTIRITGPAAFCPGGT